LWVKAIALSNGNVEKTESVYIKLRVSRLAAVSSKNTREQEIQVLDTQNVSNSVNEDEGRLSNDEDYKRWKSLSVINKFKNIFYGRLSLAGYWLITFWYITIVLIYVILTSVAVELSLFTFGFLISQIMTLFIMLSYPMSISFFIRRLHDFGNSGWWAFMIIVPVANIGLLLGLLFTSRSKKDNKFGKVPSGGVLNLVFNTTVTKKDSVRVINAQWHYYVIPLFLAFLLVMYLAISPIAL
jgi:uncharacterized membrane protein YhaH (DUF805 family)